MRMQKTDREQQLRALYDVPFPEDLHRFWDFAKQVNPEEPLRALAAIETTLVGPFDVLAGRLDQRPPPDLPMCLHWRYYLDPPEFFTVLSGCTDGLHWGYWFDAPGERPPFVCSYYTNDAYEFADHGTSLFDAVAEEIRGHIESHEENKECDPNEAAYYDEQIAECSALLQQLGEASASGTPLELPKRSPVAPLFGGIGLLLPAGQTGVRKPEQLAERAERGEGPILIAEAAQALQSGQPGRALQIARTVWIMERTSAQHPDAAEVCARAYEAMGRETLASVCRVHAKHRDMRSVDILSRRGSN